jgi:hypothetical protein
MDDRNKPVLHVRQPHNDGVGAQLFRIFSAYAIAKEWNMDFSYEPLNKVDNQVFQSKNLELESWNAFLAKLLPLNSSIRMSPRLRFIHRNHRPAKLLSVIRGLDLMRIPATHILDSPQVITNKNPEMLAQLNFDNSIRTFLKKKSSESINVVLHIRQGELALSQFRDRYLPLGYFESFLAEFLPRLFQSGISFTVSITTEPGQNNLIRGDDPKVIESIKINPENPALKPVGENLYKLIHEKPSYAQTPYLMNANWLPPRSSWDDFRVFLNADVLVLSKSSFSYLAGILNKKAIVVCPQFWHPALPGWYSSSDFEEILLKIAVSLNSN